ncbi:phosphoribosylamine--glycine ligase [Robiginitalea sp.]|nr:phosphoribosylamine--glycine ligase [Robiginitalea sp.]
MNILVLGSGGREHAMAWKLSQSPNCEALFVAPGNAGTNECAINLPIAVTDFEAIREAVIAHKINLVVVGPEVPLVLGIVDFFTNTPELSHVGLVGPTKEAAQLEGSKEFAKAFMTRHHIPTAGYASFGPEDLEAGYNFLEAMKAPYVLKADGLAAGKGVLIIEDLEHAKEELKSMLLDAKFGDASARVVIEEFLSGIELSCFVLTDGQSYKTLPTAKDYKRIGEGDTGLNTGGMGAISPVPFADDTFMQKVTSRIIEPTISGLKKDGIPYVGFIFIGLIKVGDDPYVIEYNVRMGDPETEAVIPRISSDLALLFSATANGKLDETHLEIDARTAATVMMVSGGYPESYTRGYEITGLDRVEKQLVFHAGTSKSDSGKICTEGGRVLAVTALNQDMESALKQAYDGVAQVAFTNAYFRSDIGFDL